jgi:hypothetical protein
MRRTSQTRSQDLPTRLFAANPALLIGAAFELGMMLGKRSAKTAIGRKVRQQVAHATGEVVRLAPDAVVNLVPELEAMKERPRRRRAAARKRTSRPRRSKAKSAVTAGTAEPT